MSENSDSHAACGRSLSDSLPIAPNEAPSKSVWRSLCRYESIVEACLLLRHSWTPLPAYYLMANVMSFIDLAFVGHIGMNELAALFLSQVIMFGSLVFVTGMCSAIRTLSEQAFISGHNLAAEGAWGKAAAANRLVGIWLQVGLIWTAFVMLPPIAVLWWFAGDIMYGMQACTEDICDLVSTFSHWSLLWLPPYMALHLINQFLEAIHATHPQNIISLWIVPVKIGLNYVFIFGLGSLWDGLGFEGSPIATAVCCYLQLGCLLFLVIPMPCGTQNVPLEVSVHVTEARTVAEAQQTIARAWYGWTSKCCQMRLGRRFMVEGFPLAITDLMSDWVLEAVIMVAAYLGACELTAVGLLCNVIVLFLPFIVNSYVAVQQSIQQYLKGGLPERAKQTAAVGYMLILSLSLVASGLIWALQHPFVAVCLKDDEDKPSERDPHCVQNKYVSLVPIGALQFFLSGCCYALQCTLDAQERVCATTMGILVGNWGVGMALILLCEIHFNRRETALWWCVCAGEAMKMCIFAYFVCTCDWETESQLAISREQQEEQRLDSVPDYEILAMSIALHGNQNQHYDAFSDHSEHVEI